MHSSYGIGLLNRSCSYLISILVDIQGHLKVNKGKKKLKKWTISG